jgi:CelD/BcsL family acetyltransferase involved in cellulose biosynthesis
MTTVARTEARPAAGPANAIPRPLHHRILDADGLRRLPADAWDALAADALVENPFYTRHFVLSGLDTMDRNAGVRAVTVTDADGRLLGLFPFRGRGKVPAPFPVAFGAASRYLFSGTPLVHRACAAEALALWLDQLVAGHPRGIWTLPDVDMQTPLVELILDLARRHRVSALAVMPYERAALTREPGSFEAHLQMVLSKNRLKDVRRTMRRLQEAGTLTHEHVEDRERLQQRIEDFLRLEHAGWKGKMGTSHLSKPSDAAFARQAYAQGPAGFAAIDTLLLDGAPLAMKLSVRTGPTAFTPKIAYDERHRKLGPGMALEYMLIEEFYRSGDPLAVDAAATAEGHSALEFFNARKSMATLILGRRDWQVRLLATLFRRREQLKAWLKALKVRKAAAHDTVGPGSA